MRRAILVLSGFTGLAACGRAAEQAANNTASNKVAEVQHPTFCFFKDEETKGWKASVDAAGNVTVTGKAHVKDSRYMALLGQPEVQGNQASLWLTIGTNTTGWAANDQDLWDVTAKIPGAGAVESVSVMCGKKSIAELALKKG
jgi:nitrous oxide reductase accessory protein NosL